MITNCCVEIFVIGGLFFLIVYGKVKRIILGRKKGGFSCLKCGKCCTLKVEPPEEDIKRIESLGLSRRDFMDGKEIKRVNGACIFLKKGKDGFTCVRYITTDLRFAGRDLSLLFLEEGSQ